MLKNRRFWIGLVITLIFLFLVIYQVRDDIGEMGRALGEANYLFLLPGILFYYLGVYFRAVRWRFVLKPLGSFSSIRIFPLIVIGMLVNNILPARLGIVARAYILGEKESISKMAVGGTMVVEQISDGVILILFAAIISFFCSFTGIAPAGHLYHVRSLYSVTGIMFSPGFLAKARSSRNQCGFALLA